MLPHAPVRLSLQGDDGPDVRGGSGDILLVHATETDRKGTAAPLWWPLPGPGGPAAATYCLALYCPVLSSPPALSRFGGRPAGSP